MISARIHILALMATLVFGFASLGEAQEKKAEVLFEAKGEITEKDPPHKAVPKGFAKTHAIKLAADKGYRFDLTSKDFDTLLFLTDESGKILAYDDDGGGG